MRNYLFLDDNSARHDQFLDFTYSLFETEEEKDYCIRHVHSVLGATEVFNEDLNKEWEILFLDHDLGEQDQMCLPGVNNKFPTGTDLAGFILENNIKSRLILLHSFNPVGRNTMSKILQGKYLVYEVPFGFTYPKLVIDLLKGKHYDI
jgi:hypothetical protein